MRNNFVFLLFFLLLFSNLGYSITKYTSLDLKLKEISPSTPKSSDLVKLTFIIYNQGTEKANTKLKILRSNYFYFIGLNKEKIEVPPKSYTELVAYIKIKNNVISGKYPLIVYLIEENDSFYLERSYEFFLELKNPSFFEISSKRIISCEIRKDCSLNLLLINKGFSSIKNLLIKSNLPGESLIIKEIRPNKVLNKSLKIFIPEDLDPGLFDLKLEYSYLDEENRLIKKEIILPINLLSNVDLSLSSFFVDKKERLLKIKVENPGEGKAKNIAIDLKINKKSKTYYLTYLDENEDTTLFIDLDEFNLMENNKVFIELSWFDNKNKSKHYNFSFDINIEKRKNSYLILLIALLIIVIVYLIIRRVRKNED